LCSFLFMKFNLAHNKQTTLRKGQGTTEPNRHVAKSIHSEYISFGLLFFLCAVLACVVLFSSTSQPRMGFIVSKDSPSILDRHVRISYEVTRLPRIPQLLRVADSLTLMNSNWLASCQCFLQSRNSIQLHYTF
jgi:hypothetical protein